MMLTALVTASTTALTYEGLYKAQQVSAAFSLLPYALFLAGRGPGSNINRVCGIWLGRKADCWQAWREVRREANTVE